MVKALGEPASRRYFITAERFPAATAQRLGLVQLLCEAAAIDTEIDALLATLLANGPAAVAASKRLVQDLAGREITAELRADTARRIADIRASDEGKEGVAAFLAKRDPAWKTGA